MGRVLVHLSRLPFLGVVVPPSRCANSHLSTPPPQLEASVIGSPHLLWIYFKKIIGSSIWCGSEILSGFQ
jgi:hypothetical protein